jgi:hypothetical protein
MVYWPAYNSLFSVSLAGWHSIATARAWQDSRQQIALVQKRAREELQGQIEVIEETEELTARTASNKDGKFDVGEAVVSRAIGVQP